jgi:hypothetical protein
MFGEAMAGGVELFEWLEKEAWEQASAAGWGGCRKVSPVAGGCNDYNRVTY